MAKLLLLSIVILLIAIPILASRDRNPRRGLKRALLWMLAFNLFYVVIVRFIYPHFL
ncbi:MAG: hypothetical protein ABIQ52_18125 [Vicinamibacterales bacterium]